MVSDVSVYSHQIQKETMSLKLLMKQFVRHMRKRRSGCYLSNDLLNDKIKDTTHKAVDTMRPKAPSPKPRAVKKQLNLLIKVRNQSCLLV